jgi:aryl-alcohol dehydrogenase-like predicted oxidoreductase
MNLFKRLCIGTANWGQPYNGVRVSDSDIEKILSYAMGSGITTIDTATAYDWDWQKANSSFDKVVKIQSDSEIKTVADTDPYCIMAHNEDDWSLAFEIRRTLDKLSGIKLGISVYSKSGVSREYIGYCQQYPDKNIWPKVIQCPYSLFDRRNESSFLHWKGWGAEIHVRSIFLRGKILKAGVSPQDCVKFCLCNPNIDKVIIGADSFEQFRESTYWIHEWNQLEKHDEELLDARKWK